MARPKHKRRRGALAGDLSVRLTRKLERVLRQGHPWVWRDALADLDAPPGTVVAVTDARGEFVARGIADDGPIGVRVFTTDRREAIDEDLFARRIESAAALRDRVISADTTAYRLLHGEGDRLPGIVCDVYGDCAVLRFASAGSLAWRGTVIEALGPVLAGRGVRTLLLRGGKRSDKSLEVAFGGLPEGPIEIREHGMRLLCDIVRGQKTGLFLDHRDSRRRVGELSRGLTVLNLYGYTGAFSVAAGLGGARMVETVDSAAPALELAEASWALNDLPPIQHKTTRADVPELLAKAEAKGKRWDLIISDPPSFAPKESAVAAALASYRQLHAAALTLLRPGGLYLAASCSSHVRRDAFEQTVAEGSSKSRRPVAILGSWGAGADHPRPPVFVEGDYLKTILVSA